VFCSELEAISVYAKHSYSLAFNIIDGSTEKIIIRPQAMGVKMSVSFGGLGPSGYAYVRKCTTFKHDTTFCILYSVGKRFRKN